MNGSKLCSNFQVRVGGLQTTSSSYFFYLSVLTKKVLDKSHSNILLIGLFFFVYIMHSEVCFDEFT
jgi:hypothetical protein